MAKKATTSEIAEKANIAEQKAQIEAGNFPADHQTAESSQGGKLEDVLNEGREIKAGGKTFIIRKWVLKDYLRLSQLLLDLNLDFDKMKSMNIDANFVMDLLLMKSEIVVKIIAFTIKEDILFVENLDLDEAVDLGLELWLKNEESFFRAWAKIEPLMATRKADQPTQEAESPQTKET